MADIEFDTTDLDKWEKRLLPIIRDTAPKEFKKTVRQAGNLLRKKARRNTPKESGELRKSYRVWMRRRNIYEVEVGTKKYYAKMVEEGHELVRVIGRFKKGRRTYRIKKRLGFVPGKFYFRKAYEETEKELPKHLKESIRRIGKEMGFDVW